MMKSYPEHASTIEYYAIVCNYPELFLFFIFAKSVRTSKYRPKGLKKIYRKTEWNSVVSPSGPPASVLTLQSNTS